MWPYREVGPHSCWATYYWSCSFAANCLVLAPLLLTTFGSHHMNHLKRLLLVLLLAVLLSACRVETTVSIKVEESGGGTVQVVANFDAEAWEALEAEQDLRLDDLSDAGWQVSGPNVDESSSVTLDASKEFASAKELGDVLAEVSGPDGPYARLGLSQHESFARSRYRLEGVLDGSMGVLGLAESDVTEALGGLPYGTDLEALEASLGAPVGSFVTLNLHVDLPGARATDAPGWSTNLAAETPLGVLTTAQVWHAKPLLLAAAAVVFALLFVVLVVAKVVLTLRARRTDKTSVSDGAAGVSLSERPVRKSGLQVVILGGEALIFDSELLAETTEFIERVQHAGFRVAYVGEALSGPAAGLLASSAYGVGVDVWIPTEDTALGTYSDITWQQLAEEIRVAPTDCLFISAHEGLLDLALGQGYPTVLFDPAGAAPSSPRHSMISGFGGLLAG